MEEIDRLLVLLWHGTRQRPPCQKRDLEQRSETCSGGRSNYAGTDLFTKIPPMSTTSSLSCPTWPALEACRAHVRVLDGRLSGLRPPRRLPRDTGLSAIGFSLAGSRLVASQRSARELTLGEASEARAVR